MNTRRIPLIIGLVLALGTGALLLTYLSSLRPTQASVPTKPVLVATRDIPARALVTTDLFAQQQRTATEVDSDAITDPKVLAGKYTLVSIPAGSIATASKIGMASAYTLPARLPVGMRAVSISIDNVKGVAGLVTPGDRVDIIAVPPRTGNGTEVPRGYAILRGVLVLAMGSDIATTTATPPPGGGANPSLSTVTLALTPKQVDLLAGADLNTVLRLALRNPKEPIRAFPAESLRLSNLPSNNAAPATVPLVPTYQMPVPAPAQPAPAAAPQQQRANAPSSGVTVIDGDRVIAGNTAQR